MPPLLCRQFVCYSNPPPWGLWGLWAEGACAMKVRAAKAELDDGHGGAESAHSIGIAEGSGEANGTRTAELTDAASPWYRRPGILIAAAALIAEVGIVVSGAGEPGTAPGGTTRTSTPWSASFSLIATGWIPTPEPPPAPPPPPPPPRRHRHRRNPRGGTRRAGTPPCGNPSVGTPRGGSAASSAASSATAAGVKVRQPGDGLCVDYQ